MHSNYKITNMNVSYEDNNILKDLTIHLDTGNITGVKGVNGAGKTTLLNCIAGLIKTEFTIDVNGRQLTQRSFQQRIAYIPDTPLIYDLLTGEENIHFLMNLWRIRDKNVFYNNLHSLLKDFDLDQHMQQRVETYSLGMKNKLFFIANIARDPEILLLDEPFTSFDSKSQEAAIQILKKRKEEKKHTLFSSHVEELFARLANRVYVLSDGKLSLYTNKSSILSCTHNAKHGGHY